MFHPFLFLFPGNEIAAPGISAKIKWFFVHLAGTAMAHFSDDKFVTRVGRLGTVVIRSIPTKQHERRTLCAFFRHLFENFHRKFAARNFSSLSQTADDGVHICKDLAGNIPI